MTPSPFRAFSAAIALCCLSSSVAFAQTEVRGTLTTETWDSSGSPYRVVRGVELPVDATLTLEPGVVVAFDPDVSMVVRGALRVRGTSEAWVKFERANPDEAWGGIVIDEEQASCDIEYLELTGASTADDGQDSYPAAFNVVRGAKADLRNCWFHGLERNMIENNSRGELVIKDSVLEDGREGIHCNRSYALIERVVVRDIRGSNDNIDFDGNSTPRSIIRDCLIENNPLDDGIDLASTSPLIEHVVLRGLTNGKAFSIDGNASPEVNGALIYDCKQGLVCKDSSTPIFRNVTVSRCERAVDCYEKISGRGGGHGTGVNLILWGNENSVVLDELSTFTMTFSDVEHGYAGDGNHDLDPLFVNAASNDFHLLEGSPAAGSGEAGADMGAFPLNAPPAGPFLRGDADGDHSVDIADALRILFYLTRGTPPAACLDALDVDDGGVIDITDARAVLLFLFRSGPPPPAPFPERGADPTDDDPLDCPDGFRYFR